MFNSAKYKYCSQDYIENVAKLKAKENNIPEKNLQGFIQGFKECFKIKN